tara:strand:+ start:3846 stop:4511 length:666 start_codon:yes stop_codon:yes gene_type:complete
MKQILIDTIPFQITRQQIVESEQKNNGKIIVQGVLQRSGAKNQNGRVYPKEVLMREANKYNATQIKERRALGELDHPESSVVNLSNASHNISKIWWEGDDLMGKVEVLSTPSGNILKELLKCDIKLGISSRGLGSVNNEICEDTGEDTLIVQDDFELVCWDFVSNPSTHGAFMHPTNKAAGVNESYSPKKVKANKYNKVENIISEMLCELTCKCSLPRKRR